MLTLKEFKEARGVLSGVIRNTSLVYSPAFSKATGNQIYIKPENMQVTGAYKIRGAYYKISTLSDEEKARGLVTASAGNHAQGVAYAAKLAGVPVGGINLVLMLLTAVTVSVASRIVGALMISSLLVIPVAAAMMIAKSYKQTIWWSIAFAEFFTVAGLFISYYLDLRPGGTIVLLGVVFLIVIMVCTSKRRR